MWDALGIGFRSIKEECADTTSPIGRFMLTVVAGLAEMERATTIERIKAGMDRARRQGKHLGRPRVEHRRGFAVRAAPVLDQVRRGELSRTRAAAHLGISHQALRRLLAASERVRGPVESGVGAGSSAEG